MFTNAHRILLASACLASLGAHTAQAQSSYKYTDLKLSTLSASNADVFPHSINTVGQVGGSVRKPVRVYNASSRTWSTVWPYTPVRWSASGAPTTLGMPKGINGSPATANVWSINSAGATVGEANGSPAAWNASGALTALDTRPGVARFINDSGVAAGVVEQADIQDGILLNMEKRRATVWRNGSPEDLQASLPRGNGAQGSEVGGLNNAGTVGLNVVNYLSARYGACWLLKGTTLNNLQNAQGDGCQIRGVAEDDTVALVHQHYTPNCDPQTAACQLPVFTYSVWRQGQQFTLPGTIEALNPDGSLILTGVTSSTGLIPRALWRDGSVAPLTFNVSNPPGGTLIADRVDAVNRNGQIVWNADFKQKAITYTVTDRHGVLTPQR
jgi:hypothetical protein